MNSEELRSRSARAAAAGDVLDHVRLGEGVEAGDDLPQRPAEPGEFADDQAVAGLQGARQLVQPPVQHIEARRRPRNKLGFALQLCVLHLCHHPGQDLVQARPEPSGGHEAVERGPGHARELGDGGLRDAQLEESAGSRPPCRRAVRRPASPSGARTSGPSTSPGRGARGVPEKGEQGGELDGQTRHAQAWGTFFPPRPSPRLGV